MEVVATKTSFQKYPAYKDSGVEWLGEIPEHWTIGKLGTLLKPISLKGQPDLPLLSITRELGVIERNLDDDEGNHNFIPDDLSGYKVIRKGQFGMNKMKAWQGSYGISPMTGIVSPAYYIFDFTSEIDPNFFHKAVRSKNYVAFFGQASDGVRIGQWDLAKSRMKAIPFFIPPKEEQTAIANFLDDKTAKIDRAIAQKEQLIALLKERKQIIIQNAVTKGLDPTVKMKDSGVEWIGEIPEGWGVKPLRFIGATQNGISAGAEYFGKGFPFVSYGDVYKNIEMPKAVSGLAQSTKQDRENYSVRKGDIFFTRTSETVEEIGFSSTCLETINNATFAGFLIRFRPSKGVLSPSFSKFYFSSVLHRAFFVKEMNLVIRASLSQDLLKKLPVLLPSMMEQEAISNFIETQSAKIDQAISLQQTQIKKLKEYKATLIDSAVTGKIKVG